MNDLGILIPCSRRMELCWFVIVRRHSETDNRLPRLRVVDLRIGRDLIPDAQLFIVALRNVLRAGEMLETIPWEDEQFAQELRDALLKFRRRIGAVKSVRDVLEHFDAYGSGSGHLRHYHRYLLGIRSDGSGRTELRVGKSSSETSR